MTSFPQLLMVGIVLTLVQLVAALPWLTALNVDALRSQRKYPQPGFWLKYVGWGLGALALGGFLMAMLLRSVQVKETLDVYGRVYGTVLHVQLAIDFFVLTFALLILVWPKGAAVALAAFREGWRQPMYWLLTAL